MSDDRSDRHHGALSGRRSFTNAICRLAMDRVNPHLALGVISSIFRHPADNHASLFYLLRDQNWLWWLSAAVFALTVPIPA
ncbi:hypothetical protein [Dickeya ananatis]|uniref:hypothetical protein n=1 Tax=Dickeya ananatis TaxID=3061286 RepID=UPI00388CF67F